MDIFKFFRRETPSKVIARERLKLLLIHDRADCSPKMLEMLKTDIIKVISNYMEIEEADMDIQISANGGETSDGMPMLLANIPIKGVLKEGRIR